MTQQNRQKLLALLANILGRRLARTHQIADPFMDRIQVPKPTSITWALPDARPP